MANKLSTSFSFDDRDFSKIDTLKKKLTEANNLFNNFGGSVNFTQKINSDFDELNKKLGLLDNNLKKLGNSDLTGKELKNLSTDLQQQARAQKLVEQAKRATLQTAIEEIKLERQKIGLQRESLALEAAKQKLFGKPDNDLKNALADIQRYKQQNINAEKEITAQLQRESKTRATIRDKEHKRALNDALKTVSSSPSNNLGENGSAKFVGNSLKLSSFQKQNLSYQINDVLTGLASGQPITQIAAQQSGQIAQIFNPAQAAALVATYGSLAAIAGAGATAIALTYKLTGDLRTQAEKRLSVENSISAAINKQILGLREAHSEYEKFKRSLQQDEDFSNRLTSAVNTSDASAIKREQERIDAKNSKRIDKIGLLLSDLAQKERSLEFAKNRNVNQGFFATLGAPEPITQGLFTTLGIGRGYTVSQKQLDVSQAESAVEKTKKELAETEVALKKGEAAFQRTGQALDDITTRQNEAFNQRNEIFKRTQENERKFTEESQKREADKLKTENAKRVAEFKKSVEAIEDLTVKLNQDNPFVSLAVEGESAIRKLKDTITDPTLLQSALKLQQAVNLKQSDKLSYQSESRVLTSEQNAERTSRIRDNELGGFIRALETVDKKVDFAVKMFEINKKIDESDFFAYRYNPNNPKSFDESRFSFGQLDRFGESAGNRRPGESFQDYQKRRQEAVQSTIRVSDAFDEINKLKNLSTGGTGIFGESIVADKILERLPSREDLLRLLSSTYAGFREGAQFLLSEQSNALRTKRDLEAQKLQDFLYDQQTKGLNQTFAQQQLDVLGKSGLNSLDRSKATVDILSPLGNDISPQQRRELYENQLAVAKYERQQKDDAQKYLKNISDRLDAVISANGLKVDGTVSLDDESKQAMTDGSEIILRDLRKNSTGSSGTELTVADNYGQR